MNLKPELVAKVLGWVLFGLAAAEAVVTVYHEKIKTPKSRKFFFAVILITPVIAFLSLEANSWKDEVADREKRASDERVKFLESETAKANQGIAQAKLRTEELTKSNLQTRTDLERSSASAAVEKQKLGEMQIQVASARKQQADAEKSLEQVKERMRPRTLTSTQRVHLLEALAEFSDSLLPNAGLSMQVAIGDAEARTYANQIRSVLLNAGWKVIGMENATAPVVPQGVMIFVEKGSTAPPYAGALQKAFGSVGVEVKGVEIPSYNKDQVTLFVGSKSPE